MTFRGILNNSPRQYQRQTIVSDSLIGLLFKKAFVPSSRPTAFEFCCVGSFCVDYFVVEWTVLLITSVNILEMLPNW